MPVKYGIGLSHSFDIPYLQYDLFLLEFGIHSKGNKSYIGHCNFRLCNITTPINQIVFQMFNVKRGMTRVSQKG